VNKKNKGGRPTVITEDALQKLEHAIEKAMPVAKACQYAGIAESTYYEHLKKDEGFRRKMDEAKHRFSLLARNAIEEAVRKGDANIAIKWLERREKDEFSTRREEQREQTLTINLIQYTNKPNKVIEMKRPKQLEEIDSSV